MRRTTPICTPCSSRRTSSRTFRARCRRLLSLLSGLLLLAGLSFPARAGRVAGRVTGVPRPVAAASLAYSKFDRDPGLPDAPPHPLIVVLKPASGAAGPAPPAAHPVIDQQNERFVPRALAVRTGTTVDFLNSDNFYHNVFSLSPPRKFDLGRYRKGNARQVTFTKPGLVKLFCDIHPDMIGYVLVTESPWFASASVSGDYAIENVPPGEYGVELWYEPLNEPARVSAVRVGDEAEILLDLTAPGGSSR